MKPQVPTAVRERRRQELLAKQEAISAEKNRALFGKRLKVLVEKETSDGWVGRSYREAPEIDGLVRIAPSGLLARARAIKPGDFLTVEVTGAEAYEVYGRVPAAEKLRTKGGKVAGKEIKRKGEENPGGVSK